MTTINAPDRAGVWKFEGYRITGHQRQIETMCEVVLVQRRWRRGGEEDWFCLRFGKAREFPVSAFYGEWIYVGEKEKE